MNIRNSPFQNGKVIAYSIDLHIAHCLQTKQLRTTLSRPETQPLNDKADHRARQRYMQTSRPRSERDNRTNKQKLHTRNKQNLLASLPPHKRGVSPPPTAFSIPHEMCRGRFFFPRGEFSHNSSMADGQGACDPFGRKSKTTLPYANKCHFLFREFGIRQSQREDAN